MTHHLDVQVRHDEPFAIIEATGEIDVDSAALLREAVTEVTDGGTDRLVFDLTHVTFIDSVGLGVFVLARKKMQLRRGTIDIVAPTRRLIAIFTIARLDTVFRLHPSLASVLAGDDPAEPA